MDGDHPEAGSVMRIDNRTHWRTDDIRAIVTRAIADELEPARRALLVVAIRYGQKGKWTSGCAYYNKNWMQINVGSDEVDSIDLAHTACHEAAHCRGVTHAQMRGAALYRRVGNWREIHGWAADMPIRKVEVAKRGKVAPEGRAEAGRAHAAKLLAQHETKIAEHERILKRERGLVTKWRRKVRYYEKRIATIRKDAEIPTGAEASGVAPN